MSNSDGAFGKCFKGTLGVAAGLLVTSLVSGAGLLAVTLVDDTIMSWKEKKRAKAKEKEAGGEG